MNINHFVLLAFAEEHRVDYNALCVAVRGALGEGEPSAAEPETPALSPEAMRRAGRPYCPLCFTFGHDHGKTCDYRGRGMTKHVVSAGAL